LISFELGVFFLLQFAIRTTRTHISVRNFKLIYFYFPLEYFAQVKSLLTEELDAEKDINGAVHFDPVALRQQQPEDMLRHSQELTGNLMSLLESKVKNHEDALEKIKQAFSCPKCEEEARNLQDAAVQVSPSMIQKLQLFFFVNFFVLFVTEKTIVWLNCKTTNYALQFDGSFLAVCAFDQLQLTTLLQETKERCATMAESHRALDQADREKVLALKRDLEDVETAERVHQLAEESLEKERKIAEHTAQKMLGFYQNIPRTISTPSA
jgi:hypothetical protein